MSSQFIGNPVIQKLKENKFRLVMFSDKQEAYAYPNLFDSKDDAHTMQAECMFAHVEPARKRWGFVRAAGLDYLAWS